MDKNINSALTLLADFLSKFASSSDFWSDFEVAFGNNYDRSLAKIFQQQWQSKSFTPPA